MDFGFHLCRDIKAHFVSLAEASCSWNTLFSFKKGLPFPKQKNTILEYSLAISVTRSFSFR